MDKIIVLAILFAVAIQVTLSMTTPGSIDESIECGNFTCSNNAKCKNDSLPYTCQCHAGFMGETCHEDRNECLQGYPCYHRGRCHNTIGSWWCECLDGWNGTEHCGENITESRLCMPGWSGEWCETCLDGELGCGPNGLCRKKHGKDEYYCSCQPGYHGRPCADIDECTSRPPCLHSGTCINNVGSFHCDCTPEWAGSICNETNICYFENPCSNSGTCTYINQTTYLCHCPDTWKGINCTDDVDECVENKCKNGASCNNTMGSYSCNCTEGWEGDNCDTDINECESFNPCNASLVCVNVDGSYTCEAKIVKDDSGGANIGIIAGATTGALLAILAAVLALLYKFKWKRNPPLNKVSDVNGKGKTEVGNKHFKQPIKS